jgi:uncharacterized protein YbdZ (MbtH family)
MEEGSEVTEREAWDAETEEFVVVCNDEEQYSVWWADRELPAGWTACP